MIGAVFFVVLSFPKGNHDCAIAQSQSRSGFDYQRAFREGQAKLTIEGVDSCKWCHESGAGRDRAAAGGGREDRNEWDMWYDHGKGVHARTYVQTLSNSRSERMASLMSRYDNLGNEPTQRADCLGCHSYGHDILLKPESQRKLLRDGVGCEACHGRAQYWEGVHDDKSWRDVTSEERLAKGMYDTRDVERWAEKCLECHLGSRDRRVSHRLMGAGHPGMSFELATDSFGVPMHWDWNWRRLRLASEKGNWYFVRLWAVGQAVELRETMKQLQQFTAGTPDFAFFDCYACHHNFLETPSRAPGRRRLQRPPGEPAWGETSCVVSRQIVSVVWPEARERFDNAVAKIRSSLRLHNTDWEDVMRAAEQLEALSDQLTQKIKNRPFDKITTARMLVGITRDVEYILGLGPMAADHAYRAIIVLYKLAWRKEEQPVADEKIQAAMRRLQQLIYPEHSRDMSRKNKFTPTLKRFAPDEFRGVMRNLNRYFLASLEPAKASLEGPR